MDELDWRDDPLSVAQARLAAVWRIFVERRLERLVTKLSRWI